VRAEAALALLCAALGGLVLHGVLRARASRAAALACPVLLFAGTSLGWTVWPAPDARAAAAFLLAALAVAWSLREGRPAWPRVAGGALGLAAALAVIVGLGGGVELGAPRLGEALFSSRHGLLFWNPLLWAGLAGLPRLGRRDAAIVAAGLAAVVIVVACVPAGASGPWAARRFTAALPLLAPGLALTLDTLAGTAARRPGRLLAAAGALAVAWNLLFMEQYRHGQVPRDGTVSFPAVAENNARLLARLVGSPTAWPANWVFAWRHGLPPDRFDLVAGKRLPKDAAGARDVDVGEPGTDAALLLDGWSVRHFCEDAVCRDVDGRARLLAPLEEPGEFALSVRATGEGLLAARVNGQDRGAMPLGAGLEVLRFPAGSWGRLNEISLSLPRGGRARVDRVRLERPGGAS
jgi:hypothetical protein